MSYGCFRVAPVPLGWTDVETVFLPWWGLPRQVWTQQLESFEQPYEHTETTWRIWTWCTFRGELLSRDSLTSKDPLHHHSTCFGEAKSQYRVFSVLASLLGPIFDCLLTQTANQSSTLALVRQMQRWQLAEVHSEHQNGGKLRIWVTLKCPLSCSFVEENALFHVRGWRSNCLETTKYSWQFTNAGFKHHLLTSLFIRYLVPAASILRSSWFTLHM